MSFMSVSKILNESSGLMRTLPVLGINKGRGKCWGKMEEKEIKRNKKKEKAKEKKEERSVARS